MYTYINICMYVYTHIYIYIHIYTQIRAVINAMCTLGLSSSPVLVSTFISLWVSVYAHAETTTYAHIRIHLSYSWYPMAMRSMHGLHTCVPVCPRFVACLYIYATCYPWELRESTCHACSDMHNCRSSSAILIYIYVYIYIIFRRWRRWKHCENSGCT